jgi:hypothetical protein
VIRARLASAGATAPLLSSLLRLALLTPVSNLHLLRVAFEVSAWGLLIYIEFAGDLHLRNIGVAFEVGAWVLLYIEFVEDLHLILLNLGVAFEVGTCLYNFTYNLYTFGGIIIIRAWEEIINYNIK